jgi:PAS domain S-box-containing protein
MADLPDRRNRLHITRPWLHSSHTLVFRAGTAPPDRKFVGRIALFRLPLHARLVREEFPAAQLMQYSSSREVVQEICRGTVSAGFLEARAALAALRELPVEYGQMRLRVEPLPDLTLHLGLGSTFEAARAADKIRIEIDNLFRNGTLAATMVKYSYYGLDDTWTTYDLMQAAERARWLAWGIGALGIALAVTVWQAASLRQRKRAEVMLRESEERFRAIFQQAAVGVGQMNLAEELTMVNDRCCEVLGYTREELLGTRLTAKIHPDDLANASENWRRLLEGVIPSYSIEVRCVHKDRTIIWVGLYGSTVRDGDGRPKYFVTVFEDITKRKRTEAALQESEERFRNMADTAPVMIWVAGPDKLFSFFNKTWLDFTGRTVEQELGNGWLNCVHSDDVDRSYAAYYSSFDSHRSFHIEYRLRRADGKYRWVLSSGVPRFGPNGDFAGYIGSNIDITDLRQSQEEAIARQKLESLGVLAGGVAHDFNNLLGSILTNSELALSELSGGSPAYEGVESIKQVADRAAGIVRQMMAYAGQEKTVFEPLNLSGLVKELLQLLKVSISKRAILAVDLPEDVPLVQANAAQIRQVVMNLITNASEALGEKEGVISITVTHVRSEPDSGNDAMLLRSDHLRLIVSDTGSGMTEEIKARIFDPFFTTKFAGRGLGLAAVQGIIRDHNGGINVISAPGRGSQFEVLLPCTSQLAPDTRDILSPVSAPEAAGTILMIEDEDTLRVAVSKMLRRMGFSVIEADDGAAGVDQFRSNAGKIDVVLLDLTMPGMTGREVLEELRRLRPDIQVILTTAYSQDSALSALGDPASWLYLRKPYKFKDLLNLLRIACLRKPQSDHKLGQASATVQ